MKVINCDNLEQFVDTIYLLTVKGLTFEADSDKLKIVLTGGY